jgi:hypothetical protein
VNSNNFANTGSSRWLPIPVTSRECLELKTSTSYSEMSKLRAKQGASRASPCRTAVAILGSEFPTVPICENSSRYLPTDRTDRWHEPCLTHCGAIGYTDPAAGDERAHR